MVGEVAEAAPFADDVEVLEVGDALHVVRRAGVEEPAVEHARDAVGGDGPHGEGHDAEALVGVPGEDAGLVGTVEALEAQLLTHAQQVCEGGDAASAVAAHGAEATVGVVVAHLEVEAVAGGVEGHQAVGADAEAAVAEARNLVGAEAEGAVAVVDDHEVVAGAIELME